MLLPWIPHSSCSYLLEHDLFRELPPPATALKSTQRGKKRVESILQVLWSKKTNIPGSRTGEKDVGKIIQIGSKVFKLQ